MAKSKKNKVVHLTQVRKKGKDHKEDLMKQLHQYVAKFKNVYIFDFNQTESSRIMNLRIKLKDVGSIFSGKISLLSAALKKIGTKTNTNFDELLEQVAGRKGFLFTDMKCNKLVELVKKEAPEFCEKLIGYAQIAPKTKQPTSSVVDAEVVDDSGPVDSSLNEASKKKRKEKRPKRINSNNNNGSSIIKEGENISKKREVKFVKI